jgi:glycosyltransferase involved in cell wall biosynthesis
MNKRALMIAFHFPPQAASSGIQRTLSFSKHLSTHNWEPLILSANPIAYSAKNPSQLASLPQQLIVKRAFAVDAKRHMGILGRYPEILAVPDRWISWWLSAVPAGLALIREYKPAVIWSTFPIATSHLIGLTLHRLTGIPWVADFRDPMLQSDYPTPRLQRKAFRWIEQQTLARCQKALFTTRSALDSYRQRFPDSPRDKLAVIENGYDEDSLSLPSGAESDIRGKPGPRITLLHSGVLYPDGRDPSPFLQAIALLKSRDSVNAESLCVILRAPGDLPHVMALVEKYGLEDIVKVERPVPYHEALQEMLRVDGLLVFQGTPFNTQIPAKIYEYFWARKPILGLLDPAGETARVLTAAGFYNVAPIEATDAIVLSMENFILQIRSGDAHVASDDLIAASSRKHRAAQLAQVFNQVTADSR